MEGRRQFTKIVKITQQNNYNIMLF